MYRYYQCQSRSNEGRCGYHTWREPLLEEAVLSGLRDALRSGETEGTQTGPSSETRSTQRERLVGNAQRRFLAALKRTAHGEAPLAVLGGYLKDLDAAREALTKGNAADPESVKAWETMDAETRRAFLVDHVRAVTVKDDGVEVAV